MGQIGCTECEYITPDISITNVVRFRYTCISVYVDVSADPCLVDVPRDAENAGKHANFYGWKLHTIKLLQCWMDLELRWSPSVYFPLELAFILKCNIGTLLHRNNVQLLWPPQAEYLAS